MNMEFKNFRIDIVSDDEHEDLYAEIECDDGYLTRITQEEGFDKLEIDIFNCPEGDHWTFPLDDFLEMIEISKQWLWKLRRFE